MLRHQISREDLIAGLSRSAGITPAAAAAVLEALAVTAAEETKLNGGFVLPGIGFLERREAPERTVKNPRTGESIRLPAKTNLRMELASRFVRRVNPAWEPQEAMLKCTVHRVTLPVLEGILRDGNEAKEWNTLDPKRQPLDGDLVAVLQNYADEFAYVLRAEGPLPGDSPIDAGFVTPAKLQERCAALEKVDLALLEKEGVFENCPLAEIRNQLAALLKDLREAVAEKQGLVILTTY